MMGGFIGVIGAILIVLIIALSGEKPTETDEASSDDDGPEPIPPIPPFVNPMVEIFAQMPDLSKYKKDGTDEIFKNSWWNHPEYGGPFTAPIKRKNEDGTITEIENESLSLLNGRRPKNEEFSRVFTLTNIQHGIYFYDLTFYARDQNEVDFRKLEAL